MRIPLNVFRKKKENLHFLLIVTYFANKKKIMRCQNKETIRRYL